MFGFSNFIFFGHVGHHAPLKLEGVIELSIARFVELHDQIAEYQREPFQLSLSTRDGCTYQLGQKHEKLEKFDQVKWVRIFFLEKYRYYIGLQGKRGLGSRISGSRTLKMLRKKVCSTWTSKNEHFQYILKNRLFT